MNQNSQKKGFRPGPIALFGSGETSPKGRKVFEHLFRGLPHSPQVALLETPAGFELNSDQVIGRVGEFLEHRLQNFNPQIEVIPARRLGTYYSPNNPKILGPLLNSDLVFMGPGSPTYAVRQLRDSTVWHMLIAHHYLGGAIALASAATIAISRYALPVYEIYKVGEDLHWKNGLDFFGLYGLPMVFIPHWNNNDGGVDLDTSRCFMGVKRFDPLLKMLPADTIVVGIDELTALIIDPLAGMCRVIGTGGVTLLRIGTVSHSGKDDSSLDKSLQDHSDCTRTYQEGETFPLSEIGPFRPFNPETVIPHVIWQQVLIAKNYEAGADEEVGPPDLVIKLLNKRETARSNKDWEKADHLRDEIAELGWNVIDTPDGPQLKRTEN